MDGPCYQFLTRSAGAGDEDGRCAGSDHFDQAKNLLHFAGRAAHPSQRAGVAQSPASRFQFRPSTQQSGGI